MFSELPVNAANLIGEELKKDCKKDGGGKDKNGFCNIGRLFSCVGYGSTCDITQNNDEKDGIQGPVRLDQLNESSRLDLTQEGGESKVFRKITIKDELKANIVKSHHFMESPILSKGRKVGKPPLKRTPISSTVAVNTKTIAMVLLFEMEVMNKFDLFHFLPAGREAQGGEHGAENDDGVENSKEEDKNMSKVKRENDRVGGTSNGLVENKAK